ncbi:Protein of unknown function [Cotesia congregata]|uniref:Uncharacterized protein n=1 Tax=Cotesia congregata TaxID=51543 RepID=A0A8J2H2Q9_COTCN|nr:Protein of unknown function [Cotesia congregata]
MRPILSYAAPIWWNTGASIMEKYRKLERSCLRSCLGLYKTAESDYKKCVDNKTLYNSASIPRFDIFILRLTRRYYSTLNQIDNIYLKNLKCLDWFQVQRMAKSKYSAPEIFTNLDKLGFIQNENNIPTIFHVKRRCTNKAIPLDENIHRNNLVYSTAISDADKNCLDRLSENYWWLQEDAKFIDELRRRARLKQQQQQRRQRRAR